MKRQDLIRYKTDCYFNPIQMTTNKINDKITIFLSYSWEDFEIANKIEADFTNSGLSVVRDTKMQYKDDISNFMKKIKNEDFAILLISNNYLCSPNCMREVLEILDYEDFTKKILPIILSETKIFKPEELLDIIKFWEIKIKDLNLKIKALDSIANVGEIIKTIDIYTRIRESLARFVSKIQFLNCKTFKELEEKNYKPILDHIGVVPDDIIALSLNIIKIASLSDRELEIDKLLEKYPKNGNLSLLKANLYLEEKKYRKAEILYKKLIEANSKESVIYNNLGICYAEQRMYEDAITSYHNAIALNPHEANAYSNLALLLDEKFQKFEEAEQNYILSMEYDYFSSITHSNYAKLLVKKGDYQKSSFHYKEAIKYHSIADGLDKLASFHYSYAHLLHVQLHEYDEAKIHYENCLTLDSKYLQAHCNLAVLLIGVFNDLKGAEFHYNESLKISPKDSITLNNLGNLYQHHLNNNILAKFHYEKAIEFNCDYRDPYNGLGLLYFEEDPIKSKEYFEKALEKDFNYAQAHFNMAKLLKIKFNENELAKKHYLDAVNINFSFYNSMNNDFFNVVSFIINI